MPFTQLTPPLPVEVTGKGKGMAFAVIEDGPENELVWVSALDATGEIYRAASPQVRMRLKPSGERGSAAADKARSPSTSRASSVFFRDDGDPSWGHARAIYIPDADAEDSAFP